MKDGRPRDIRGRSRPPDARYYFLQSLNSRPNRPRSRGRVRIRLAKRRPAVPDSRPETEVVATPDDIGTNGATATFVDCGITQVPFAHRARIRSNATGIVSEVSARGRGSVELTASLDRSSNSPNNRGASLPWQATANMKNNTTNPVILIMRTSPYL